jgi:hypothetical protein
MNSSLWSSGPQRSVVPVQRNPAQRAWLPQNAGLTNEPRVPSRSPMPSKKPAAVWLDLTKSPLADTLCFFLFGRSMPWNQLPFSGTFLRHPSQTAGGRDPENRSFPGSHHCRRRSWQWILDSERAPSTGGNAATRAKSITALVVADREVAWQILALNTEKAPNLKEKALEVTRIYRGLVEKTLPGPSRSLHFTLTNAPWSHSVFVTKESRVLVAAPIIPFCADWRRSQLTRCGPP